MKHLLSDPVWYDTAFMINTGGPKVGDPVASQGGTGAGAQGSTEEAIPHNKRALNTPWEGRGVYLSESRGQGHSILF